MGETLTRADKMTFWHNGFKCEVVNRPDLYYLYQVRGYRESDKKHFRPPLLFENNLTFEQIRDASIAIMDGTFEGKVEVYGQYNVYVGA